MLLRRHEQGARESARVCMVTTRRAACVGSCGASCLLLRGAVGAFGARLARWRRAACARRRCAYAAPQASCASARISSHARTGWRPTPLPLRFVSVARCRRSFCEQNLDDEEADVIRDAKTLS